MLSNEVVIVGRSNELRLSNGKVEDDIVVGKHLFGNLYGVDPAILGDEEYLRNVILEAVKLADMTLVELRSWSFGGKKGGVSVIALVKESHIALHTWINYGYATLDIYTCGARSDPWKAYEYVISKLRPKYYTVNYADRSSVGLRGSLRRSTG